MQRKHVARREREEERARDTEQIRANKEVEETYVEKVRSEGWCGQGGAAGCAVVGAYC